MDAIRRFVLRTILDDSASAGMERLMAKARQLTEKAIQLKVDAPVLADNTFADFFNNVDKEAKKASTSIHEGSQKAVKAHKEHSTAIKSLREDLKAYSEQMRGASETVGNFFSRLDAGKLVVAGAAAGLLAYAKSVTEVYEAHKLNLDILKDQMGSGLMSFIGKGGQESGTSEARRADLAAYMSMTGYKDEAQIQKTITSAEKIMASKEGSYLKQFGVNSERDLLKVLSSDMDPNSDLGRIVKKYVPTYFTPAAYQTELIKVGQEAQFQNQPQAIREAEARRRMAAKAIDTMSGKVKDDPDSYRRAMRDMSEATDELSKSIGETLQPGITIITQLVAIVVKMIAAAPDVAVLVAALLTLGVAFATISALLPLLSAGFWGLSAAMLANPIGLIIVGVVALGIALAAVERRTQLLSKAWDYFAKSEIGKDLIGSVTQLLGAFGLLDGSQLDGLIGPAEYLAGIIRGLFDQVDSIYKMLKSGDIQGALVGGLKLMVQMSPAGMVAAFLEGQLPVKRIQERALFYIEKLWVIWEAVKAWIRGLLDGFEGFYNWLKSAMPGAEKEAKRKEMEEQAKREGLHLSDLDDKTWLKPYTHPTSGKTYDVQATPSPTLAKLQAEYENLPGFEKGVADAVRQGLGGLGDIMKKAIEDGFPDFDFPDFEDLTTAISDLVTAVENFKLPSIEDFKPTITTPSSKIYWLPSGEGFTDAEYQNLPLQEKNQYLSQGLKYSASGNPFSKNALGGDVTRSGLAWVDEGEPIVPAEVARNSPFIDGLRGLSGGGGGTSISIGDVHVSVLGSTDRGTDPYEMARQVKEALLQQMGSMEFENQVEAIVHRKNRSYIG